MYASKSLQRNRQHFDNGPARPKESDMPDPAPLLDDGQSQPHQLYRPLDKTRQETRILLITNTEPLEFAFESASMTDDQLEAFDAISWCWGDTSAVNRKRISIEGHELSVSANAYEVLIELCIAKQKKRIWIDAVCINQDNKGERSQQVAMMDIIYKRAATTLVWLGKDSGIARKAMEMINKIAEWRQVRLPEASHPLQYGRFWDEKTTDPFPLDTDWDAISSLFSATWFTRFWIIQEVVLSKHVHVFLGKYEMCWKHLILAAHYIAHNSPSSHTFNSSGMAGVGNATTIGRMQADNLNPLVLLRLSPEFGATEPRDRVFALYGLLKSKNPDKVQDVLHKAFLPNYDSQLVDIYTNATRAAITSPGGTDLLLQVGHLVQRLGCENPDTDFPSWVPRYHFVDDESRGSYKPLSSKDTAGVAAKAPRIDPDTPRNILRIAGVVIDTISGVYEQLPPLASYQSSNSRKPCGGVYCSQGQCARYRAAILRTISQLWDAAIVANLEMPLPEIATMLRTTLLGRPDQTASPSRCDCDGSHRTSFREFVARLWPTTRDAPIENDSVCEEEQVNFDDSDLDQEYSDEDDPEAPPPGHFLKHPRHMGHFWNYVVEKHVNRRFFLASSGRMGSAAPRSRTGDKVCLVSGLAVPLLLRQVGSDWVLIGDAYLSGEMKVQAFFEIFFSINLLISYRANILTVQGLRNNGLT